MSFPFRQTVAFAVLALGAASACTPRIRPATTGDPQAPAARLPEASVWGTYGGRFVLRRPGRIDGQVVGDVEGEPIAGATLWILGPDGAILTETRSAGSGKFRLEVPASGDVLALEQRGR